MDWLLNLIPGGGYAKLALLVVASAASAWAGHQVGVAGSADEIVRLNGALRSVAELVASERAQRAEASEAATLSAAAAARRNAQAESRRAAAHQAERDRLAARIAELTHAALPVTRCRLPADEQRLLDDEYAAYTGTDRAAGPVRDPLPADAAADRARVDQPARPVGPAGLGRGLQVEAGGLHRVD